MKSINYFGCRVVMVRDQFSYGHQEMAVENATIAIVMDIPIQFGR
jgi:hypothetical protein